MASPPERYQYHYFPIPTRPIEDHTILSAEPTASTSQPSTSFVQVNENYNVISATITKLIPLGTTKAPEELIVDSIVDYVFRKCKEDANVVYCALYHAKNRQEMEIRTANGPAVKAMLKRRRECCVLLAIGLCVF